MSHPFNNLRDHKVQRARVGTITRSCGGMASSSGGGVNTTPRVINRKRGGAVVLRADGGEVRQRSDRPGRAFGGRLGGKKKKSGKSGNHVNVIVQAHPKPPMPMMPPPGVAAGPPPMPPKPPMMPPPAGPGPGGAPPGVGAGPMPPPGALPPPGMPPRYTGGRAYKKGGAVFSGAQTKKSMTATRGGIAGSIKANADTAGAGVGRTPVQPSPNKQDGKNIGRKPVITKATGGPISSKSTGDMGPKPPGGGGGGKFRKWETARLIKSGYGGPTRNAQNPTRDPAC